MREFSSIRLMVVDDHEMVRTGLKFSLMPFDDINVVGEASSGEEALTLCTEVWPDVVLMDVLMPGIGGVEAIATLHETCPDMHVIALSSFTDGAMVREALHAGATGYLVKDVTVDELVKAIRLASHGIPTLAASAAQELVRTEAPATPRLGRDLTERERAVLRLLATGSSNQQIAEELVITPATVKFHTRGIRAKLGTTTRTETVLTALQHHLVPMPSAGGR